MREIWPADSLVKLEADIRAADDSSLVERIERLRFLEEEFGPPSEMGLAGGIGALLAIGELKSSFLCGNYMATIFLCQTFVEHSLAGPFALAGEDEHVEKGMSSLIDVSLARNSISSTLAARLHELREMRNPYTHPRILQKKPSLLDRVIKTTQNPFSMAEADATEAIRIVVDFLREGCPSWTPSAHGHAKKG
jgi:hypothetical protein